MKAFTTWTVLPHKPAEKHGPRFWTVRGTMPNPSVTRVMSVARMDDGGLVIHNGIALEDAAMKELEAFGTPRFIVVPNAFHRMDARIYKDRYPQARVLCPAGARSKVEEVVPVDGSYADLPADTHVTLQHLDGMKDTEGVLQVADDDGTTLVFNDVLMNQRKMPFPMNIIMGPAGRLSVPRVVKWVMVKDRAALAAQLRRLAALPGLHRLVMSHGHMLNGAEVRPLLEAAVAETLL